MDLTKSVNADRRRNPARLTMGHQGTEVARTEALWPTRSSRMGRHYFVSNNFFCGHCRNYRPIRRVGKAKVFWGLRKLFLQGPKYMSVLSHWHNSVIQNSVQDTQTMETLANISRQVNWWGLCSCRNPGYTPALLAIPLSQRHQLALWWGQHMRGGRGNHR